MNIDEKLKELHTLEQIVRLFDDLDKEETRRTIAYLADRFGGDFRPVWILKK